MNPRQHIPLLILDVDDILTETGFARDPAVVARLNALVDAGAVEPAWCTARADDANRLAEVAGLHGTPWPAITGDGHEDPWDPAGWWKSTAVAAATLGRDYVWAASDINPLTVYVHQVRPRAGRGRVFGLDEDAGLQVGDVDAISNVVTAWRTNTPPDTLHGTDLLGQDEFWGSAGVLLRLEDMSDEHRRNVVGWLVVHEAMERQVHERRNGPATPGWLEETAMMRRLRALQPDAPTADDVRRAVREQGADWRCCTLHGGGMTWQELVAEFGMPQWAEGR